MTLYDLTIAAQTAQEALAASRASDLADWRAALDPVLAVAGEPTLDGKTIEHITVSNGTLTLKTSFVADGSTHLVTHCLPVSVLRASDPVQAAHEHQLTTEIRFTKIRRALAERAVRENTEKLRYLEAELAVLSGLPSKTPSCAPNI